MLHLAIYEKACAEFLRDTFECTSVLRLTEFIELIVLTIVCWPPVGAQDIKHKRTNTYTLQPAADCIYLTAEMMGFIYNHVRIACESGSIIL